MAKGYVMTAALLMALLAISVAALGPAAAVAQTIVDKWTSVQHRPRRSSNLSQSIPSPQLSSCSIS